MRRLEELCRPLLAEMCEYCCFAKAGKTGTAEKLQWKIRQHFDEIQAKCENDLSLKREFSRIEKPLVFFIDYMVKEGEFPFSQQWTELARQYNELSGDEKFFDMLSETFDDPEASDRLRIFYLMLGLGFNGCRKDDLDYIERRMRLCCTRFPAESVPLEKELLAAAPPASAPQRRKSGALARCLVVCIVFAVIALGFNCYTFLNKTRYFRNAVQDVREKINLSINNDYNEAGKTVKGGRTK